MTMAETIDGTAVPAVDRPALRAGLLAAAGALLDAARAIDTAGYAGDDEGLADDAARWLEDADGALVPVRASAAIRAAQVRYAQARRVEALGQAAGR